MNQTNETEMPDKQQPHNEAKAQTYKTINCYN